LDWRASSASSLDRRTCTEKKAKFSPTLVTDLYSPVDHHNSMYSQPYHMILQHIAIISCNIPGELSHPITLTLQGTWTRHQRPASSSGSPDLPGSDCSCTNQGPVTERLASCLESCEDPPSKEMYREARDVLSPNSHLLIFISKNHRMIR